MFAWVSSLRLRLLVAMVLSAALGLAGAAVLYGKVEQSHEVSEDRAKATNEAKTVGAQLEGGAGIRQLAALQELLLNDRLTVRRGGTVIFRGPRHADRELELTVRVPFSGGVVWLADYSSPKDSSTTVALTLITAGVLALVIAAAILTATLVTRSVRAPVGRAIAAADRLAHGDLGARMGASGPTELVKLGQSFDEMADRLERVDTDRRQFLADVAHEIATPVGTISGFAQALADGTAASETERAEARALIGAETRRLRALLDDLRELTSLDLGEGVRVGPLDLQPFADELVARFRVSAEQAEVKLKKDVRPGTVVTDVRLVEAVASNLLSNAIRYTAKRGSVDVRIRRRRGELVISVRDTGIGIPPEHQQRIFERLYRVDQTRDRASGGSGLGLSIAFRAAQSLGGRIELDSEIGRGSEFRLIVPVD
jgi:two-component system sensor histidine kinase BaeS